MFNIKLGSWIKIEELEKVIEEHKKREDIHRVIQNKKVNAFVDKYNCEMLPIFYYAKKCKAINVYYVDDNKPDNGFDGKIKLSNGNIINIECTNAIDENDAQEQKQRDNLLRQQGNIELPHISIEVNKFRENIFNLIKRAIDKKIIKSQKIINIMVFI